MRRFLDFVRDMMLALGFFIAVTLYMAATAAMATVVINDFQLDTYVTLKTGVAATLFVILTTWPPAFVLSGSGRSRRNEIKLDSSRESW
tara:strand:- start:1465 stop:1731 length:267 start_codon:yes stop_codon:yes gene_type:complete